MAASRNVLALDVGDRRIGVARASYVARLPEALATIDRQAGDPLQQILQLVNEYEVDRVVVGLPRGMSGQETAQTAIVRQFADELGAVVGVPIDLQDEAGTSLKAEDELRAKGASYVKGDIDALAAVYILEDWFAGQPAEGVA